MGEYFPVQLKKGAVILEKPSGAIAITDPMTVQQRKFYDAFLYVAKKDLEKNPSKTEFTVELAEIKKVFGIEKDKNNARLKKQIKKLMSLIAEYNILDKDKEIEWKAFSILPTVGIKDGIVEFEIPTMVKRAILNKRGVFGKIDLVIIRDLNSKYSVILYELLKDYQNVEIPKMTIDQFKRLFGLEGKYKDFSILRKRTIDVAIKELNNNPNIEWNVGYELYKTGPKYTHIKFIKTPKPLPELEKQKAKEIKNKNYKQIVEQLMQLVPEEHRKKNTEKLLLQALSSKGYEYVEKQIEYANKAKPKQYVAYLRKAIEQDYAGVENSEVAKELEQIEELNKKYYDADLFMKGKKYRFDKIERKGDKYIIRCIDLSDPDIARKVSFNFKGTIEELEKRIQEKLKKIDT